MLPVCNRSEGTGMADKRFRLVGQTKLRNDQGHALQNHVSILVDGNTSVATADAPQSPRANLPIVSDSPDVARFLRRWNAGMEASARYHEGRNRPPVPDPKPKELQPPVNLPDHFMVPCPSCNGEGWYLCQLCDGEGCCTRRRADEWRNNA